mmetsp:Transcript_8086/g.13723  ORF Transcript_8086/g.13723 Transcript_8086/m.13723 type:complete len:560 (-) Transcript_8086:1647-3326(-)
MLVLSFGFLFAVICVCNPLNDWNYERISTIQMNHSMFPVINRASTLAGLSPYGYRGDARRVHTAIRRDIEQHNNLTIVVLGASVTVGHGLADWYTGRYTTVMRRYLVDVLGINVTIHNLAIRASASDSQCDVLFRNKMHKIRDASLVLVDISLNDRPSHKNVKDEAKRISRLVSSSANATERERENKQEVQQQEKVGAEGRKMMKFLQYYLPKTVGIVYFETFVSGGRTNPLIRTAADLIAARRNGFTNGRFEHKRDSTYRFLCQNQDVSRYYHWQPLLEYKIPVISYLDAVCPFTVADPSPALHPFNTAGSYANTAFWGRTIHHDVIFHKFTAVVLTHAIFEYAMHDISETSLDSSLPTWMPHQRSISKQQITDWNTYIYDPVTDASLDLDAKTIKCSMDPVSSGLHVSRFGMAWSFFEDVPGKPGWISSSQSASNGRMLTSTTRQLGSRKADQKLPPRTIIFKIKLQRIQPIIKLSVLMSYDTRMGVLRCCIEPMLYGENTFCHSINTLWSDKTSQVVSVDMSFATLPGSRGEDILRRELVCSADQGKVKVVDMVTC